MTTEHAGSGYGYGYGYGSGYGDGSGYGNGDGDGFGDGYGSGDGYGYGSKEYWASVIAIFAEKLVDGAQGRLAQLRQAGATIAFWRSDKHGKACNGGSNAPVQPGTIETIKGPLKICTSKALHATLIPPKWKGERVWLVALTGEVQWQDDRCGALSREIIGECL